MTKEDKEKNISSRRITAQSLAIWADILRDRSARGLHYASNIYDKENYQKIQEVAIEMVAAVAALSTDEIEPLRTTLFARSSPTPAAEAAIIDDAGRILLIRRAATALWAMPGGGIDVGETPAQAAVREALEETGILCEPIAFVGLYDSRLCGSGGLFHLYHLLFLCRALPESEQREPASHAHEVLETGWFAESAIPEALHPGHALRLKQAFRTWHGDLHAYFDH